MDGPLRQPQVLSPQNVVTLGNLACGVGAIVLCTMALIEQDPRRLYEAALWLVLATFFDAVDGKIARMTGTASPLGAQWQGDTPENTLKPKETVTSLSHQGVMFSTELAGDEKAQLVTLVGEDGEEFWVGFHNFFVITRYNRSVMYALAVHQLGQEIALEVNGDRS